MAVTFTDAAVERMLTVMKEQNLALDTPLRLSVRGGGCAGFEYQMDFSQGVEETDKRFDFDGPDGNKLTVVVDPKSYLYLNNIEVDFSKTLMDSKFVFNNPNASRSCGCGTSFDV